MKHVLGVDQSLTHTVIHLGTSAPGSSDRYEIFGDLGTPKKRKHVHDVARLDYITSRFEDVLKSVTVDPGYLFLEGYAMGARNKREALGEWGGQIRLLAYRYGWDVVVVAPMTLKKYVCGRGNEPKDGMRMYVLEHWGYKSVDDDDSDAYALMRMGIEYCQWKGGELVPAESAKTFKKLVVLEGRGKQVIA